MILVLINYSGTHLGFLIRSPQEIQLYFLALFSGAARRKIDKAK